MKRIIKKNVIMGLAVAVMISLIPSVAFAATANTKTNGMYEPTNVLTAAKSYNSILVSWQKVNKAGGYILSIKKPKDKRYTKVATIGKSKVTSYTISKLSKKTSYKISVCPYKKVKGRKVLGPATYVSGYTGLKTPKYVTRVSNSNFIATQWQTYDNAAGLEIYRTTMNGDVLGEYVKIGSPTAVTLLATSTKANQPTPAVTIKYNDIDIKDSSTLYYYKVRSFTTFGNKKVYSDYSDPLHTYAKNTVGKYTASIMTASGKTTAVIVKIKSDSNNYSTYYDTANNLCDFGTKFYNGNTAFYDDNGKKIQAIIYYSTDNKSFTSYSKALTLNADDTIYIKLSFSKAIDFTKSTEEIRLGYDYNNHRGYSVTPWKYSQMSISMDGTNSVKSYYK